MRRCLIPLAFAVLVACAPEKVVEADPSILFSISPETGFESLWKAAGDVVIYEVFEDSYLETSARSSVTPEGAVSVRCRLGADRTGPRQYKIVSAPVRDCSFRFPSDGYAVASSSVYSTRPVGATVRMESTHLGTKVAASFSGLPDGAGAEKAVLTFPSDAVGNWKMDWTSGKLSPVPAPGEAANILELIPSGGVCSALVAPLTLSAGSKISAGVWQGGTENKMECTLSSAVAAPSELSLPFVPIKPEVPETPEIPDKPRKTKTYTNPVTTIAAADPTVWRDGGYFYLYSTMGSSVKKIYRSTDLVTWTSSGLTPFTEETNSSLVAYGSSRWAPDVIKIGDTWNFYITVRNDSSSGIAVLTSKSATGPYSLKGRITYSGDTGIKDSIDPEVVVDPGTGKVWLFFGSTGKMHRVQLNSTGTALAEGAEYTHVAGLNNKDVAGRDKVFEGAYLYYRDGYWYLFASAGEYWNETYKIVVGRSESLEGTFLNKDGKLMSEGYSTTILSTPYERLFGPGHNGEIFTDSYGDDYIVYHCHDKNAGDNEKRFLCLQQIFWDKDGWPYFEGGKPVETGLAPVF